MRSLILLFSFLIVGCSNASARLLETKTSGIAEMKMQLAAAKATQPTKETPDMLQHVVPMSGYRRGGSGLLTAGIVCMGASPVVFLLGGSIFVVRGAENIGSAIMGTSGLMFGGGLVMVIVGAIQRSNGHRYSSLTPFSGSPNEIGLAYHF